MVKSVSGYCVCQSWLLSHPVTYISILGRSIFAAELARILVIPGAVDPTQAYHITGHANGIKISFMVDTGQQSVLSMKRSGRKLHQ